VIEASGLTKIFFDPKRGGEFRAVGKLLHAAGRIFGLPAPTGGKTTTPDPRDEPGPTAGRATVDGIDVVKDPGARPASASAGATGIYERLTPAR
jgi:ABC-type Na+ transport system ATPase subunit NatA